MEPVSEAEATAIIRRWGELHDAQAGLSAFLPIIAEEGFYMVFGAQRWEGYADFEDHQLTKRRFFDEHHEYEEIVVEPGADVTVARTQMRWTYRFRPERSPRSQLLKARLAHTWEFRRCPRTGRAFMQGHVVESFVHEPGFGPDDPPPGYDPHLDAHWRKA